MGTAVAFADLGDFRATSFPNVSRLEADQFYFEPEIGSEHCFEDIVGKSAALRKVLEQVAIVAPTDSTVLLHGELGVAEQEQVPAQRLTRQPIADQTVQPLEPLAHVGDPGGQIDPCRWAQSIHGLRPLQDAH